MSDLNDYSVVRSGTVTLNNVPQWTAQGIITNREDGGPRVVFNVNFPQILGQLTAEEQDEFVNQSMLWLLFKRFGVAL